MKAKTEHSKKRLATMLARADKFLHGTRARYVAGKCRCAGCRAANAAYQRSRDKGVRYGILESDPIVSAERARRHIFALSRAGVGRRSIRAVSNVAETIIVEVKSGRRKNIRRSTERRILAVKASAARADHAFVSSAGVHQKIALLLEEGYTKTRIARELGTSALQFKPGRPITVRNAARFERVYVRLTT
jgi:hypothetical protein